MASALATAVKMDALRSSSHQAPTGSPPGAGLKWPPLAQWTRVWVSSPARWAFSLPSSSGLGGDAGRSKVAGLPPHPYKRSRLGVCLGKGRLRTKHHRTSVLIVYAYISVSVFSKQEKRTSAARRYRLGKIFKKPDRCTVGHALDAVDGSAA